MWFFSYKSPSLEAPHKKVPQLDLNIRFIRLISDWLNDSEISWSYIVYIYTVIYLDTPGYSLIILDIPSFMYLDKNLVILPHSQNHQKKITTIWEPPALFSNTARIKALDGGGCRDRHGIPGSSPCFKWRNNRQDVSKQQVRGHWEKGLVFCWDENSLNMWVFTGLQLTISVWNFHQNWCQKFFSFNHQLFYTFQGSLSSPQKCRFAKVFIKNSENRFQEPNRFALFIGSIHWTSMVNQQLKSFLLEAWRFHGLPLGMQQSTWFNGSVFPGFETMKKITSPPWGCE